MEWRATLILSGTTWFLQELLRPVGNVWGILAMAHNFWFQFGIKIAPDNEFGVSIEYF